MALNSLPVFPSFFLGDLSDSGQYALTTVPLYGHGVIVYKAEVFLDAGLTVSPGSFWRISFGRMDESGAYTALSHATNDVRLTAGVNFLDFYPTISYDEGEIIAVRADRLGSPGPMVGVRVTLHFKDR